MRHCPFSFSMMGAICSNMQKCQRNDPWRVQLETQGGITLFGTDIATHSMVEFTKIKIKKLKKGSDRKLSKSGIPKRFWDDCLELESHIRYNTAHGIYKIDKEIPETIMSGNTSNIHQFCEIQWFKWVMFQDETVLYPNDHFRLGRYLGLSIDIFPPLMAEIIKENGQVLHRFTCRAQTQEE